ncbi:LamG-like jellyroll fold domain-containing protein [Jatrophihabitans endophyticus]|uniref:LamG-like jellyroll fold domain-containing protein n=1 Tax=Jatrophihabitans endophyticus TaxID=1206085 RepID=UPI001356635F|nr:LamG-like jellyroll fold domain-containing protein [Jatrophihabitans endophyticus]
MALTVVAGLLAGGVAGAVPAAAGTVSIPAAAERRVVTANDLIESVGVNVHTYYNDTAYADTDRVRSLLQGLGVRHVRDGLVADRPDEVAALRQLGAAGIRSSLIVGGTKDASTQSVDPAQLSALTQVAPYVDAVEPTNEYDCSGDSAWAAHQRAYAEALVQQLQSSDELRRLGVFAPAFCRPGSIAQFGSVQGLASVTNVHTYSGGAAPELALESRLPAAAKAQDPSLPLVVTEAGYTDATAMSPTQFAATDATAADYTVRTLLDAARLGVARTYLYELLDEKPQAANTDPEQHYGLVRYDGTVKPAYTAVRNLLADVALGSPASVAAGAARASDVTSVRGGGSLLRTLSITDPAGGGETLALWLATPVEDAATHDRVADTSRAVRVQVSGTHTATVRQPSRGNAETSVGTGTGFTVPVDGGVTLLHLAPTTATTTATAAAAATTSCTAAPGYATLAGQLGAVASSDLARGTGWSGSPVAATDVPDGVTGGAEVTAAGQQRRVGVPGSPTSWTIALWERTDASAADFSTFVRAVGASGAPAGGFVRTYDTTGDAASHVQLSGYGLPAAGASYGTETFGQALAGTWHLVTLSVGGGKATLAVDGVAQGTVASGAAALTGVEVGALSSGFRGAVAGLTVFPKALGADDIGRLATTSPGSCEATSAAKPTSGSTAATPKPTTKPATKPVAKQGVATALGISGTGPVGR